MAATTFPTVAVPFHTFVYNNKCLISRIWWYFKLKNLFFNTVYCLTYENFNPTNEVNYNIYEHKIILKPVYTTYDKQLLLQFQMLINVDPWLSNPAVVVLKTSIKVENSRWNPRWLPAIEMIFKFYSVHIIQYLITSMFVNKSLQKEQWNDIISI